MRLVIPDAAGIFVGLEYGDLFGLHGKNAPIIVCFLLSYLKLQDKSTLLCGKSSHKIKFHGILKKDAAAAGCSALQLRKRSNYAGRLQDRIEERPACLPCLCGARPVAVSCGAGRYSGQCEHRITGAAGSGGDPG